MGKTDKKALQRDRIRRRIRGKISGDAERPRLSVFRSNRYIYAQLIDDAEGVTLAQASSREDAISADEKMERSKEAGKLLAERAQEAGITKAVFDRGGYRYHGHVKALAEGAREGGLHL